MIHILGVYGGCIDKILVFFVLNQLNIGDIYFCWQENKVTEDSFKLQYGATQIKTIYGRLDIVFIRYFYLILFLEGETQMRVVDDSIESPKNSGRGNPRQTNKFNIRSPKVTDF